MNISKTKRRAKAGPEELPRRRKKTGLAAAAGNAAARARRTGKIIRVQRKRLHWIVKIIDIIGRLL